MRQRQKKERPEDFVVVSHGMLGYGFPESSIAVAIEAGVDLIAVDAGSTDPGPYYLGSGNMFGNEEMIRRDLALLLEAQEATGARMVIGSAGGAGTNPQVDKTMSILREEVTRQRLQRKVAVIRSELTKDEVRKALVNGKVRTFETGAALSVEDIDQSEHIVAQIGIEPMIAALREQPDIVLCGRAWDPANIAALPVLWGYDRGLSIHAGKILECGSLAALPPQGADLIMGRIRADDFIIEPCGASQRCTVETVAAHNFYEKTDPLHLPGPGGWSDLSDATFDQLDPRRVRVAGSRFVPDLQQNVKLEGARLAGWRYVLVAGLRDPIMIGQLDPMQTEVVERLEILLGGRIRGAQYKIRFHRYGLDGVMGALEPVRAIPHEIGLVLEVVGDTESIAATVIATIRSLMLHWPYAGRIATAGNLAFPFSPAEFSAGPVYEFSIYHLMEIADPARRFTYEMVEVA